MESIDPRVIAITTALANRPMTRKDLIEFVADTTTEEEAEISVDHLTKIGWIMPQGMDDDGYILYGMTDPYGAVS